MLVSLRLWNSLPSYIFFSNYNLTLFKRQVFPFPPELITIFFFFPYFSLFNSFQSMTGALERGGEKKKTNSLGGHHRSENMNTSDKLLKKGTNKNVSPEENSSTEVIIISNTSLISRAKHEIMYQ